MNIYIFLILLLQVQLLNAQNDTDRGTHVSVGLGIDRVKEREQKIKSYADSINNYLGGIIPAFLSNKCFDLQVDLWDGFHSPVSLRWKVLEKVNNKQVLKIILDTHIQVLKQKCNYSKGSNPEINIPEIDKSFYQLIQKRYTQIK